MNPVATNHWARELVKQSAPAPADWLGELRNKANDQLDSLPLPRRKLEAWRYSRVDALLKQQFTPVVQAPDCTSLSRPESESPYMLVFVDGWFSPALSRIDDLPGEVTLKSIHQALNDGDALLQQYLGTLANAGENLFTALNTALINDGLFLHVPSGVCLEAPVEVFYLNSASEQALLVQPRNLLVLDERSEATVIEHFLGDEDKTYFHNNITEVQLHGDARLSHYRIQDESNGAWHLSNLYLQQGEKSHYHGITLSFGGKWARTDYRSSFSGPQADCDLRGLYVVGDDQLSDFHLDIHHNQPACNSREQFKGLLYGKGRAVFDGRILVDQVAQLTDAQLTNDNLMLTRNAEVDTKPQLEIYADDVKCSHGTTVGQLDPQQIFYLRSRGIEESAATHMLCQGYAQEVIEHIHLGSLREQALKRLQDTLEKLPE
ncbi:MAG TPA: Fe-S cluster assembly protein SufD [Thiolapillus brandeum]|uniref:Fe-S cluster assembly protein SufD n=1 Tax=Thiolapillus brandeum TaxID=1076588 RepID=A0A831WDU0_9GAMM|nr:Fe-S cluster assembly protein SufD [Thiolapillus brandeum]